MDLAHSSEEDVTNYMLADIYSCGISDVAYMVQNIFDFQITDTEELVFTGNYAEDMESIYRAALAKHDLSLYELLDSGRAVIYHNYLDTHLSCDGDYVQSSDDVAAIAAKNIDDGGEEEDEEVPTF